MTMPMRAAACRLSTTPPGSISVARNVVQRDMPAAKVISMLLLPSTINQIVGVTGVALATPWAQVSPPGISAMTAPPLPVIAGDIDELPNGSPPAAPLAEAPALPDVEGLPLEPTLFAPGNA